MKEHHLSTSSRVGEQGREKDRAFPSIIKQICTSCHSTYFPKNMIYIHHQDRASKRANGRQKERDSRPIHLETDFHLLRMILHEGASFKYSIDSERTVTIYIHTVLVKGMI